MVVSGPSVYASEESWLNQVPERYQNHPMFTYPGSGESLPPVLLIGDSISISYTQYVRDRLAEEALVYRAPDNCGTTRRTLANLDVYLGEIDWQVIHVNCGIHDVTLTNNGDRDPDGSPQVPLDEYRENLTRIIHRLNDTGATPIWATTTPVTAEVAVRRDKDIRRYNDAAAEIMRQHEIPINDLYGTISDRSDELYSDGVHFTDTGASVLADEVANAIRDRLVDTNGV